MKGLLEIFHRVEAEGGQATLSVTTHRGKTKLKLEIVSPPSETAPPSSPPAPGRRRRRRRGAAARALAKQRAAAHQATLAEAATSDPLVPSSPSPPHLPHTTAPHRPLHRLLSPSPSSGRRRIMSPSLPQHLHLSHLARLFHSASLVLERCHLSQGVKNISACVLLTLM